MASSGVVTSAKEASGVSDSGEPLSIGGGQVLEERDRVLDAVELTDPCDQIVLGVVDAGRQHCGRDGRDDGHHVMRRRSISSTDPNGSWVTQMS